MSGLTPAMQQYREIKRRHRDAILFFRMGDFYEMFGEDARMASRLLEIALTTRQKGQKNPIPMCGIPYHAAEAYIGKLISAGHKVAICDQMEEASESKGIVRREVTKVVTPGTVLSPSLLEEKENHYLCGIYPATEAIGLALLDHTTGEFAMAELAEPQALERLQEELCRFAPKEILIPSGQNCSSPLRALLEQTGAFLMDSLEEWAFEEGYARQQLLDHFRTVSLEGFGCEGMPAATIAAGVLLHYLKETQKGDLGHITRLSRYSLEETMFLDPATQRNLELTVSLSTGSREGSLLGILDKTVTAMGARKLRSWVLHPLKKLEEIERRQEGVAIFYEDLLLRERLRGLLKEVGDIERLMGRIVTGAANARDLLALKRSVQGLPQMRALLSGCPFSPVIEQLLCTWDDLEDLFQLIEAAIVPHPPLALKEGGLIREGYSRELDEIKEIGRHGKDWIAQLEETERERTGIVSLKVGYNRVFGYYIEVTRRNLERIPPDYQRRQTLVNAERFITPELKEWEEKVLGAEERIVELEYRLFDLVREEVARKAMRVQAMARTISQMDGLAALGEVAQEYDYVRPQLDEDEAIQIVEGRHPVLERLLSERFIPNDAHLDCSESQLLILTGPNMAGKCVAADTWVFTNHGVREIHTLMPCGSRPEQFTPLEVWVKGGQGIACTSHFYHGGTQRTIRIRTRMGFELEGTPEHRIWVRRPDNTEGWKPLEQIEPDDAVVIIPGAELWANETKIDFERPERYGSQKRYRLPTQLNPDLAYVMGLLVGDGTLTYRNYLNLSTGDAFIAHAFRQVIAEQFGCPVKVKPNGKDFYIASKELRLFFKYLGLSHDTATGKRVPDTILRAPRSIVVAFLQGLFDSDGYADTRYGNVSLSTSSRHLARQVQILLLNMGIISSRYTKPTRSHPNFLVTIFGENAIRFHDQVGFRLPRKRARAMLASAVRHPNVGGIPHLDQTLKAIQGRIVTKQEKPIALKRDKAINSIFYTYLPNRRQPSYAKLAQLVDYCDQNDVACDELKALLGNRYFYDRVVAVEAGQAQVYDLSVPEGHAFVANGFLSHNSTYLRQVALIILMAQIGGFVPAREARLSIVDRIFTRVGAHDNLLRGQSTFMVEMSEAANIVNNATPRSLIVLDEIGRGTSTFDGISLAWAIAEYVHDRIGAKTLFATHYHELTELETALRRVKNYSVAVRESDEKILFLRKILPGGMDKSYGIQVAQLAGLPQEILERAREVLSRLENGHLDPGGSLPPVGPPPPRGGRISGAGHALSRPRSDSRQLPLFPVAVHPVVQRLQEIEINHLTPLEALNLLGELQGMAKQGPRTNEGQRSAGAKERKA